MATGVVGDVTPPPPPPPLPKKKNKKYNNMRNLYIVENGRKITPITLEILAQAVSI